jgi:hypothetical protein
VVGPELAKLAEFTVGGAVVWRGVHDHFLI